MKFLIASFLAITALSATPKAVIFDWGNVLATPDREVMVDFLSSSLYLSKENFEKANLEKRKAVKAGKTDIEFWLSFAAQNGIALPTDWQKQYQAALKASVGADPKMYTLANKLKEQEISVGILSNIDGPYVNLIRNFGFYDGFEPCLLSAEIGVEKPAPEAYEKLLQILALAAKDVVFIDDKLENIEAAKKFGIDAIVFESSDQIRKELKARGLMVE